VAEIAWGWQLAARGRPATTRGWGITNLIFRLISFGLSLERQQHQFLVLPYKRH